MKSIKPNEWTCRPFQILDKEWALLVAGAERPNPMTVSWGSFGTLWNKPTATIYVRPSRYTFNLLNEHPQFTLNFLPESFRSALNVCGTKSGRDIDKWEATKLSPQESKTISVPYIEQSRLALECRVMTHIDLDPKRFYEEQILTSIYPDQSFHRVYFGEVCLIHENE
jgi:flavin reductase (DIM6/NTAB) family NADH-FMN oxidoreductase RutF